MKRRMVSGVAVVLALAMGVAACGDDDDEPDSSAAPSASSGGSASGETETLKIASVAFSQYYEGALPVGVKTRFDMANANEELPGYTIDYLGLIDDLSTPEGAVAAFRKAKEQDGVFAIVGNISVQSPTEYANSEKLPVVAWGVTDSWCTHGSTDAWFWFSITGCALPTNAIYGINLGEPVAKMIGNVAGKTAACIGEDYPNNVKNMEKLCASFAAAGVEVVLTDASMPAPPAVVGDYSPFVQKLMTANDGKPVDVIGLGTGPGGTAGLAQALVQAGFKGTMVSGNGYSPQQTDVLKGVTAWANFGTPLSAGSTPEMATILDSFKAAGVPDEQVNAITISGWLSADMFIKIAKEAGEDLTPESFAEAGKDFTFEIEGVVGPTVYPTAFAAPTPCSELSQSDGTKWTVVRPYTCDSVFSVRDEELVEYDSVDPAVQY